MSAVDDLLKLCLSGGTRFQKHAALREKIEGILGEQKAEASPADTERAAVLVKEFQGKRYPDADAMHAAFGERIAAELAAVRAEMQRKVENVEHSYRMQGRDLASARSESEMLRRERDGEVWVWTGNSDEDDIESLACPVLMPPQTVRRLVNAKDNWSFELDKVRKLAAGGDVFLHQMVNALDAGTPPHLVVESTLLNLSSALAHVGKAATQKAMTDVRPITVRLSFDLDAFQREQFEWTETVFAGQTAAQVLEHLREEVGCTKCGTGELEVGGDPLEMADVFMLVTNLAQRQNEQISVLVRRKFDICKARTWDSDPESPGFGRHTKAAPGELRPAETPEEVATWKKYRKHLDVPKERCCDLDHPGHLTCGDAAMGADGK